ncbi:unnamed protein product [Peronospora belbahrii]|uniref:Uncharacterized protein n=1 Tax=Peronospora belbahrii TaxID=622444 RepID=A0ABN8CP93_9STRA|nr:unnamed protein product [Peronospora belbahrii]
MRDLDAVIKALVSTLKDVTAHVVVENTKLQLHKWWILFAENSCAWFDPDSVDEMDDRSYDKFTCLQDALYIWHNEALLYTTKDDFVDPERLAESAPDQTQGTTADGEYDTAFGIVPF